MSDARKRTREKRAAGVTLPAAEPEARGVANETRPLDLAHYSQWHLAKSPTELSEVELGMAILRVYESFTRWVQNGSMAVTPMDLGPPENLLLHAVRSQTRPRGALQVAQILNRNDLHNVMYSLKKLEKAGLVQRARDPGSKTHLYSVTPEGARVTEAYAALRRRLLIPQLELIGGARELMATATRVLTLMTGIYEEQACTAVTYIPDDVAAILESD